MIRLIVGRGNPGPEYAQTRHNAGFWFVEAVASRLRVALQPERGYFGLVARTNVGGRPLWLLVQRWLMGTVLAGLALKMATEARR